MEAANRGAYERGAPSIGFNIELPREQAPNPYITPGLGFRFHYFAIRKLHLLERAKAAVFFPGGYGTFDELFEVLTLLQTRKIPPLPVILVGEAYWRRAVDLPRGRRDDRPPRSRPVHVLRIRSRHLARNRRLVCAAAHRRSRHAAGRRP